MFKIAVLASGSGSNAQNLYEYFEDSQLARVEWIVTNNPKAGVISRFQDKNTAVLVFDPFNRFSRDAEQAQEQRGYYFACGIHEAHSEGLD